MWWGRFLVATATPGGLLTVISRLLVTLLLLKVRGVTLFEGGLWEDKREYEDYTERASPFFPRPPRTRRP